MSLLAKARLCQWVGQFLALRGSSHFEGVISSRNKAYCILMYALVIKVVVHQYLSMHTIMHGID